MRRNRVVIYPKDIQLITGRGERYAERIPCNHTTSEPDIPTQKSSTGTGVKSSAGAAQRI